MYEEYFGLSSKPFSIVPDPRYFFLSEGHREALAHLLYGIKSDGGFVLLTGEVGTGKTTVCRRLLEMMPEDTEVAFVLNPKMTVEELLATICDEFRIGYPEGNRSVKFLVDRIYDYLLDVHGKGRRAVLIIEEAQNLTADVLEQIRLLTNLETSEHKLLQIIMLGQPELRAMLSQPQLLQLSQRITARYHLGPLSREEAASYVNHRLSVAGLTRGQPFPPATMTTLYRLTGGIPRLINVTCDRALLGAYVQGKDVVDRTTLKNAAREVSGERSYWWLRQRMYPVIAAGIILLLLALGLTYYMKGTGSLSRDSFGPVAQHRAAKPKADTGAGVTLERPSASSADTTREAAYQALFGTWQVRYITGDSRSVWEQAQAQGLRHLKGRGSVNSLRQMNRPAVLRLVDDKDGEYYAALIYLRGEKATFAIGKESRTVDVKEIIRWWSGDYSLLWRPPPEYRDELRPGGRGPMAAWLEKRLALIQGRPAPTEGERLYRGDAVKQVKRIQLASGLIPDGIVGPMTIMALGSVTGSGEPMLHDGKGSD
jgi:general secretion pathway protein A